MILKQGVGGVPVLGGSDCKRVCVCGIKKTDGVIDLMCDLESEGRQEV